jgi:hypothetical protein
MDFFKYQKYKLIFVIILMIISYKYCERVQKSLKESAAFTTGEITNFYKRNGKSTTVYSTYQYEVDRITYTDIFNNDEYCIKLNEVGKRVLAKFPIIIAYDSTRHQSSTALVSRELLKEFNYTLPIATKTKYETYFLSCKN